ncbi:MAG: DUF349 domain-containing protein, partial [Candidatus Nitrosomaritimum aestuariumsis]
MSEKNSEIENGESDNLENEIIIEDHEDGKIEEVKDSNPSKSPEEQALNSGEGSESDPVTTAESIDEVVTEEISENNEIKKSEQPSGIQETQFKKDYKTLSPEELVDELKSLVETNPIQKIRNPVSEIRAEFNHSLKVIKKKHQEEFLKNGGDPDDFNFSFPLKKEFNTIYKSYKEKRTNYYQELSKDLKVNLENRLALIEELKGLLNVEENINTTYKHFKEIQERWFECGPIPRD